MCKADATPLERGGVSSSRVGVHRQRFKSFRKCIHWGALPFMNRGCSLAVAEVFAGQPLQRAHEGRRIEFAVAGAHQRVHLLRDQCRTR